MPKTPVDLPCQRRRSRTLQGRRRSRSRSSGTIRSPNRSRRAAGNGWRAAFHVDRTGRTAAAPVPPVTETAPRPSCVGSMRVRRRKGAQVCHSAWAPFRFFVEMEGPGLRWMRDWILGPGAWATSRTP
jgi:hypothetical protein